MSGTASIFNKYSRIRLPRLDSSLGTNPPDLRGTKIPKLCLASPNQV